MTIPTFDLGFGPIQSKKLLQEVLDEEGVLIKTPIVDTITFNEASPDVVLSRGAANRLDLATGDSLNLVSGDITMAALKTVDGVDVSVHDAAVTAVHGVGAGAIVGTELAQILTVKTLTAPVINGIVTTTGLTLPAFTAGAVILTGSLYAQANMAVGGGGAPLDSTTVYIRKNETLTTSVDRWGIISDVRYTQNTVPNTAGLGGIRNWIDVTGSQNASPIYGLAILVAAKGSSGTPVYANVYGMQIANDHSGGAAAVITNHYSLQIADVLPPTGGSITNNYGLHIANQTGGGTNRAIYVAGGISEFDGAIQADGGLTLADATNVVLGTTTGTKIGTATSQKLGFYNATPLIQPSAYTQTYATADKTHAAETSADFPAGGVGAAAGGWDTAANRDLAITRFNALRVDVADVKQLVNSIIDDLQALGLVA